MPKLKQASVNVPLKEPEKSLIDTPNCTIQHPVDLSQTRQIHQDILSLEKSQRMAEFLACWVMEIG